MNVYSLQITTVAGIADSDFLDRLADIVYVLDGLANLAMGLNEDGSLTATFDVQGTGPLAAADSGVELFATAVAQAKPLPFKSTSAFDSFSIATSGGRELAPA